MADKVTRVSKSLFARQIIASGLGKDIQAWEYTYVIENFSLDVQTALKVVDDNEIGELIFAEISVNSTLMIPEIAVKGPDVQSAGIINNWNFQTLLAKGRGMTPGDVQSTIIGQTQDRGGTPVPNAFYIQRYKDDTLTDYLGNSDRVITGVYSGPLPRPYSNISIYVKNTTTDGPKNIHSIIVNRVIYQWPGQQKLIDIKPGEQIIVDLEGEDAQLDLVSNTVDLGDEDTLPPSSEDPLASETIVSAESYNVSYDVNPLKRKKEDEEEAEANYVIPY